MIQPIVHDPLFLAQKSARATPADAAAARDLLEYESLSREKASILMPLGSVLLERPRQSGQSI